jgi:methanogenic corrinoid protein MtbC1
MIQTSYSIKDLENLSGIKAHTIRIWEKRYNLLKPSRTTSNIRYYDSDSLVKLLNITLLYNNGYKISKIANIPENEIPAVVRENMTKDTMNDSAVNSFKMSMLNFDGFLFEQTYGRLLGQKSFREIFYDVFIPLLEEIGILWLSESITPAHEHFISNLIKQKVLTNIERMQILPRDKADKLYVLYLPLNEIHELGLLFVYYELLVNGCAAVYLGQSVPTQNLKSLQTTDQKVVFISYFTTQPASIDLPAYLRTFEQEILKNRKDELWVLGRKSTEISELYKEKGITSFDSIENMLKTL